MQRRRTNQSDASWTSLRKRQTQKFDAAPPVEPTVVQERFPAYDFFPWEKIKEYLVTKWPNWVDFNEERAKDSWVFEVPEPLDQADRNELRRRRDANKPRDRSTSPE